jgi:hypothetical protein
VKFTNEELPEDVTFITAQLEGNKVVHSIILTETKKALGRVEVESYFQGEFSKK